MNKKKQDIYIDPRDRNHSLWLWLLAGGHQEPATKAKQSRRAKQRSDEYWINHSAAVAEDHRKKREAWLTDQEHLLTVEQQSD